MNERAAELGLDHTSFVDVSGRDRDLGTEGVAGYGECTGGNQFWEEDCAHYSTARDLAALARVLLDDPLLATIVSTPSRRTTTWRTHRRVPRLHGDQHQRSAPYPPAGLPRRLWRQDRDDAYGR